MIEAGASIVALSKILGHADLKTTMRYAPPEDSLKEAVEKLVNVESVANESRSDKYSGMQYSAPYCIARAVILFSNLA